MAMMNRRTVPNLNILIRKMGDSERRPSSQKYTYLDLFRSRSMAVMSLCVMYAWFGPSIISYSIGSQMTTLTGNIYLNLGIMFIVPVFARWFISIYVNNWIGRRKTYPLFMGITGLFMVTVLILDVSKVAESRVPQTALAIVSAISITGAWAAALLFSTELYPTLMRNISTGAGNVSTRIAGIIAPQVALLDMYHISAPYAVYGFFAITSSIAVYVLIPETYGRPLPEHLDDVITSRLKVKVVESSDLDPLPELMDHNNSFAEEETITTKRVWKA
ncbi:solute carrier family 22 member 15-like [Tubulanus polymorphus]|uniref:solute carrier family 22 member 15-like n=1 Tax=Tubulanus polymorphus TaxID=672921 RepID=UPI003DA54486